MTLCYENMDKAQQFTDEKMKRAWKLYRAGRHIEAQDELSRLGKFLQMASRGKDDAPAFMGGNGDNKRRRYGPLTK